MMRKGPCGREFSVWQRCVRDVRQQWEQRAASSLSSLSMSEADRQRAMERDYASVCFDFFRRLHVCIHADARHKEYYRNLVQVRSDEDADDLDDDEDDWSDESDDE